MTAAEFLAAATQLPFGTLADLTGGRGLVVVAPHPDDESLGCGGLIAEACAAGVPVRLIVVSDGTGSHRKSREYPAHRLRGLREEETCRAASELGLGPFAITFLRLPDERIPSDFAETDAAANAIVEAAGKIGAGAVCVTWEHDPHCDHVASAALVAAARLKLPDIRVFHYPIWGWTLKPETEVGPRPSGLRIDIRRHASAKAAAIAAHRSQTTDLIHDDPDGFRLTPNMIEYFSGDYEVFIEVDAAPVRHQRSLSSAYFNDMYARDADPWRFATSLYERKKYEATLAALPRTHYRSALEIGCSIGILTEQIAARADQLLALDIAAKALEYAKHRCATLDNVRFDLIRVPEQWPNGHFDLIVLSEVVYYLDRADVAALAERLRLCVEPNGDIVLVHWLGETDYPLSGDEAAELLKASTAGWTCEKGSQTRTANYRLDVLRANG